MECWTKGINSDKSFQPVGGEKSVLVRGELSANLFTQYYFLGNNLLLYLQSMMAIIEHIPSQISELTTTLTAANREYYVNHRSLMTDSDYDARMRLLQQLEAEYPMYAFPESPTRCVGSDLSTTERGVGEKRIRHLRPMLSIANVTTKSDLMQWMLRKKKETGGKACFMLEKKYDGISVSLIYRHGVLCSASTRGDGTEGTDITANVMRISGLPHSLPTESSVPSLLEMRGEIILPDEAFSRINAEASLTGSTLYQNQRNAVSAMTLTDTPNQYALRGTEVRIYQLIGDGLPDSNADCQYLLEDWEVPGALCDMTFSNPEALIRSLDDHENVRRFCGFATDGMVIKIEQTSLRHDERNTAKHYDWAIAYKWAPEWRETKLISVRFDIGRTGQINASALIDPVVINGRSISSVGLNSIKRLRELDLRYGDCIRVEMAGDCIPYLQSVYTTKRSPSASPLRIPDCCPCCGQPLVQQGEKLFCRNEECPQRVEKEIVYMAHKAGIKGVTLKVAEVLVENGVRDASAVLKFDEDLLCCFGLSKKMARKIIKERRYGHAVNIKTKIKTEYLSGKENDSRTYRK